MKLKAPSLGYFHQFPLVLSPCHPAELAKEHFKSLAEAYRLIWISSGEAYEVFGEWLAAVRQQVSAEIASVWAGGSEATDGWYTTLCEAKVENALAVRAGNGHNGPAPKS